VRELIEVTKVGEHEDVDFDLVRGALES